MSVRLYHFCSEKDMRGIRRKGICKGVLTNLMYSTERSFRFVAGWQWVTLNPEKDAQSWNTHILLKEDRTVYRWTVDVPDKWADCIWDEERLKGLYPWAASLFYGWPGSNDWRVFRGSIPKKWLTALVKWDKKKGEWISVEGQT